jgi:hypothetical protein
MLESLHHCSLDIFLQPETTVVTGPGCMRNIPRLPNTWSTVCPGECRSGRNGVVMQHDDASCEHAGTLSLCGSMKVSEGSAISAVMSGSLEAGYSPQQQGTELQFIGPRLLDSAPRTLSFDCVILSSFALMCPCCCTACGRSLGCHAHSHVIAGNQLYSLAAPQIGFILTNLIFIITLKGLLVCMSTVSGKTEKGNIYF